MSRKSKAMRVQGLSLFLLLSICLVSCNKDDELALNVSESELQFESVGGIKNINITSNTDWNISGTTEWCTVNTLEGHGNAVLKLEISSNKGTEARNAELLVVAQGIQKKIAIRQLPREATRLELSTTILHFINQDCERSLDIETDGVWTISNLPDWCTADKEQGLGNATIRLRVTSNEADQEREANLTITAGAELQMFRIRQMPMIANINGTTLDVIKPGNLIQFLPYAEELKGITHLTVTGRMQVSDITQLNVYQWTSQLTSINMSTVHMEKSEPLGENNPPEEYRYLDNEFCGLSGFKDLKSIILPESITKIGFDAFKNCKSLTTLTIPRNVTTIDLMAFDTCENLEIIYLPHQLSYLGEGAFFYCSKLIEVHIANPIPPEIDRNALDYSNVPNCTLYVPKGSKAAYENSGWKQFKTIIEE